MAGNHSPGALLHIKSRRLKRVTRRGSKDETRRPPKERETGRFPTFAPEVNPAALKL